MNIRRFIKILIVLGFVCIWSLTGSAQEFLDGVAAVVDNRIILVSEVQSQLKLAVMNTNIDLADSVLADSLRHEILQQMIDEKLLLIEAEKDTAIKVTNHDVEEALTDHISKIKEQFPSEEAFQEQLTAEGLTYKELRSRYRDEVRNQLYKEMFLQRQLSKVVISSGEVKEFYNTYKDSLPQRPAGVHLAHILISTTPGQATRDSLREYAQKLRNKAMSGEDFNLLAKAYSDDPSAKNGGDLGWFGRGEMVPEFDKAAFSLQPGQISDVVETQFGFHIIKVTNKKGNKVKASHILVSFKPSSDDIKRAEILVDSVYNLLLEGSDFGELAAKYSDDENSAGNNGDIGWFASDELFPEFKRVIKDIQPGEFSQPVLSRYGYHILKVLEKKTSRPLDFTEDYNDIEEIAKRYKTQKELNEWLKQTREKYYIEVKL